MCDHPVNVVFDHNQVCFAATAHLRAPASQHPVQHISWQLLHLHQALSNHTRVGVMWAAAVVCSTPAKGLASHERVGQP
jgi:hypothetical protein